MSRESLKLIFLSFVTSVSLVLTFIFMLDKNKEAVAEKTSPDKTPSTQTATEEAPNARTSYAS